MSDAERMARDYRDALHALSPTWVSWDNCLSSTKSALINAAQALLIAGYRMPPPPRETTVNESDTIGGWEKLTVNNWGGRHCGEGWREQRTNEADAMNAIVAWVVEHASFGRQLGVNIFPPEYQTALQARRLLEPLGITTETMRSPAKTVRVKCPYYRDKCHSGTCSVCRGENEYDAVMVEGK